jgi:hypothetical protein
MMIWRFRRLIAAYGADPARWPPGRQAGAEALLGRSGKARALLAEVQALDALLSADAKASAGEPFAAALIAHATAMPQERVSASAPPSFIVDWSLSRLWPQAVGLAAAAVLGFVIGWTDLLPGSSGADTIDLADVLDAGIGDGGSPL